MKLVLLVFSSQLVLSLTGDMISSGASAIFTVLPAVTCMTFVTLVCWSVIGSWESKQLIIANPRPVDKCDKENLKIASSKAK